MGEVMKMATLGENIKNVRIKKGMTQEELATALNTTKATISRYELDRRKPDIEQLQSIAAVLGVHEIALLPDQDHESLALAWTMEWIAKNRDEVIPIDVTPDEENPWELNLLEAFEKLNLDGQIIAVERVEELTEIPKYKKEPPQD